MTHYLDNAATTPVHPAVAAAIAEALTQFGNPSSRHRLGTEAAARLKGYRADVAAALGCLPEEVVFTSGGTEGDNWAVSIACHLGRHRGRHIITTAIEHSAVLAPIQALEREGYEVTYLQPDRTGVISLDDLSAALRDDTILVSVMLVNNELGSVQPVAECAKLAHAKSKDILVHTDGVQGFLKLPFTPKTLGVDLLTLSGHKVRVPKGVGAFYIRKGLTPPPLLVGGGQEGGLRSGTEAMPMLAGLAAGAKLGAAQMETNGTHMRALKEYAIAQLSPLDGLEIITNGGAPHILPITLVGYKSEVVVRYLSDRGVYLSSGSACHKGKPSHVFTALGLPKSWLDGALRVSFSPDSTKADVDALTAALIDAKANLFPTMS